MDPNEITAADLRAELARLNVPLYIIAARVPVHPSRLSAVLRERDSLSRGLAKAVWNAIATERASRSPAG